MTKKKNTQNQNIKELSLSKEIVNKISTIYNGTNNFNGLSSELSKSINLILSEDYFIGFFIHFYEGFKNKQLKALKLSRWHEKPKVKCPDKTGKKRNSWLDGAIKFEDEHNFLVEVKAWNYNSIGSFDTLSDRIVQSFCKPCGENNKKIKQAILKIICQTVNDKYKNYKRCLLIWPSLKIEQINDKNNIDIEESNLFVKIQVPEPYGVPIYIFSVGEYVKKLINCNINNIHIKLDQNYLDYINNLKFFLNGI